MEISLRSFFRDFNASKFVLYNCLLCFFILLPLKFDNVINLNFAVVFLPLWICETIVFFGAIIAIISFIKSPPSYSEVALRSDFYAMILCAGEHALLLLFEILACYKLQTNASIGELPWLLVFAPLFALSILSVIVLIWAIRSDKSFEMELFFSVNVVQFFFIAFKLDNILDWHWTIVFIPLWIILSLSIVGVLYAFVLAIVLVRSVHILASQRKQHLYSAFCHTLLVIPILIFLILLTSKLDSNNWSGEEKAIHIPFIIVSSPLILAIFCLVFMSIGARGGNPWWFAMRSPFCNFLLDTCPCLKQYANLSYKFGSSNIDEFLDSERQSFESDLSSRFPVRPIVPIRLIEMPD